MNDKLTVAGIKDAVGILRKNSVPPGKVRSQIEANSMNADDKVLGLAHGWKVGDEYYVLPSRGFK